MPIFRPYRTARDIFSNLSLRETPKAASFQSKMPALWTDTEALLNDHIRALSPNQPLSIDTEADSMHHYEESVCLLTVGQGETTLLIDSLALQDLSPFWKTASVTEWILHGADFDLRLMRRLGAPEPASVFDTMLAAQLCGIKSFGYAALVELYFGIKLDKANQREDWSLRPLTSSMLDYAAQDVAYLGGLRETLTNRLKELNRLSWHLESSSRVVQTSKISREVDPDEVWRIGHNNKLQGTAQAIVKELWHWRESEAQNQDVPPFKVMNNDRLLELAEWVDTNREASHFPGFLLPRNCRGERMDHLRQAIERGKIASPIPPLARMPRSKLDPVAIKRAETIKTGRDLLAKELDIDPSLLASKLIITALSRDPAEAAIKLISENRWCPWQFDLLKPILATF